MDDVANMESQEPSSAAQPTSAQSNHELSASLQELATTAERLLEAARRFKTGQ